jgi:hypothetical protein
MAPATNIVHKATKYDIITFGCSKTDIVSCIIILMPCFPQGTVIKISDTSSHIYQQIEYPKKGSRCLGLVWSCDPVVRGCQQCHPTPTTLAGSKPDMQSRSEECCYKKVILEWNSQALFGFYRRFCLVGHFCWCP